MSFGILFGFVFYRAWMFCHGESSFNCMSCDLLCSLSAVLPFTSRMAPRKAAVTVVWETTSRWVVEPWSHTLFLWFSHRMNSTTKPLRTRGPKQMATRTPTLVSPLPVFIDWGCSGWLVCWNLFTWSPCSAKQGQLVVLAVFIVRCIEIDEVWCIWYVDL